MHRAIVGGTVSAAVVVGTLSLAACGSSNYVPLTAENLSTQMEAAVQGKHSAHEVATSDGKTATIDFDNAGPLKYRIVAGSGSTAQTMIGIGQDFYVQKGTGAWLKTNATADGIKLTASSINPVTMVTGFNKGMQKLTYLGASTIDGAQVRHYQAAIDQAKYLQSLGQGTGSANIGANEPITEDLFLNNDNTLRRVSIVMPGGVGNVQIDVTKWGEPVEISAPPATDVTTTPSATPTK